MVMGVMLLVMVGVMVVGHIYKVEPLDSLLIIEELKATMLMLGQQLEKLVRLCLNMVVAVEVMERGVVVITIRADMVVVPFSLPQVGAVEEWRVMAMEDMAGLGVRIYKGIPKFLVQIISLLVTR
jgi:hypothetical protein